MLEYGIESKFPSSLCWCPLLHFSFTLFLLLRLRSIPPSPRSFFSLLFSSHSLSPYNRLATRIESKDGVRDNIAQLHTNELPHEVVWRTSSPKRLGWSFPRHISLRRMHNKFGIIVKEVSSLAWFFAIFFLTITLENCWLVAKESRSERVARGLEIYENVLFHCCFCHEKLRLLLSSSFWSKKTYQ